LAKKAYLRRYAQAIFELALENNEIDRWQSDLQKIVTLSQDAAFASALENPKIRLEDKVKVLAEKLTGVSPLALNLASLLTARGIFSLAGGISEGYQRFVDSYHGIEQAEVLTAVPLDDSDKQMLTERLSSITGKKVVMKSEVDSAILGGLVARIGGKLLDGSTRSKLAALKNALGRAG
jgi:F-type H+-transporting ATPase subunit delta